MIDPAKFRKKPVVVEAMQVGRADVGSVVQWIAENGGQCRKGEYVEQCHGRNRYPSDGALSVWITTLEGEAQP